MDVCEIDPALKIRTHAGATSYVEEAMRRSTDWAWKMATFLISSLGAMVALVKLFVDLWKERRESKASGGAAVVGTELGEVSIRAAREADTPDIAKRAKELAFDVANSGAGVTGFLVSAYSEADYAAMISNMLVAERGTEVIGFVLYFPHPESLSAASYSSAFSEYLDDRPFVLIKQIGIARKHSGLGVGRALYSALNDRFKGLPTAAAIVLEPENTRSISFHEAQGFRKIGEHSGGDGRRKGLWVRIPK
jgi:predicted GNAT superfamily acetyltransferase